MPERWRVLVCDGLAGPALVDLQREAEVFLDDLASLGTVDGWIVRGKTRVDLDTLRSAAPRLRVVGRAGVGVDNIDLEAAREFGVTVVTAPEATTVAVAEHTMGLILALARHIPAADAAVHRGEWPKAEFVGVELRSRTLGLIGLGRIGRAVAELAAGFGMRRMAFDPYLSPDAIRAEGVEPASLEAVLESADVISLHVPLTPETRGLVGREALAGVRSGALLVCTARGGVINEAALLEALEAGRLGGAALDVFEVEPPGTSPLARHPRVVATPHLGAQTAEARSRVSTEIVREVLTALRGEPARWRVV